MDTIQRIPPRDDTLTVRTAHQRGYQHVLDIDPQTFDDLHEDISRLVREEGYQLGQPLESWLEEGRGIYGIV